MGIAPIDLQTLFTQVDKVGRSVSAQKEGQVLHQSILGVELQKKTEEQIKQVNETQNMGDGVEKIKDRESEHKQKRGGSGKEARDHQNNDEPEEDQIPVLRHPNLGRKIDISL
jgi:hypothetical protein